MLEIVYLIVGLALLLFGGDRIVLGASHLAKTLGVSPLMIGMTVVAFGTSVPELAVNITAGINGQGQLCFGNVIGSNIANIGLVLGCAALIAPLAIQKPVVTREIPMMLLSVLAALVLGLDSWINNRENAFDRGDALVLILLFSVFLYYTGHHILKNRGAGADELVTEAEDNDDKPPPLWRSVLMSVAGLAMLALGGELTVGGASGLARMMGISEVLIGLTVVSLGTSLPELITCIMATRRGVGDLAVGNVVGSNIFNLLLVLGVSAFISPVTLPAAGFTNWDLVILGTLSFVLLPMAITGWRLDRKEGALLLATYCGYVTWRLFHAFV